MPERRDRSFRFLLVTPYHLDSRPRILINAKHVDVAASSPSLLPFFPSSLPLSLPPSFLPSLPHRLQAHARLREPQGKQRPQRVDRGDEKDANNIALYSEGWKGGRGQEDEGIVSAPTHAYSCSIPRSLPPSRASRIPWHAVISQVLVDAKQRYGQRDRRRYTS